MQEVGVIKEVGSVSDCTEELIKLLKERRVIPFIGSGFSQSCRLPSWGQLVEVLSEHFKCPDPFKGNYRFLYKCWIYVGN
jgi:hypothetical protein